MYLIIIRQYPCYRQWQKSLKLSYMNKKNKNKNEFITITETMMEIIHTYIYIERERERVFIQINKQKHIVQIYTSIIQELIAAHVSVNHNALYNIPILQLMTPMWK